MENFISRYGTGSDSLDAFDIPGAIPFLKLYDRQGRLHKRLARAALDRPRRDRARRGEAAGRWLVCRTGLRTRRKEAGAGGQARRRRFSPNRCPHRAAPGRERFLRMQVVAEIDVTHRPATGQAGPSRPDPLPEGKLVGYLGVGGPFITDLQTTLVC